MMKSDFRNFFGFLNDIEVSCGKCLKPILAFGRVKAEISRYSALLVGLLENHMTHEKVGY